MHSSSPILATFPAHLILVDLIILIILGGWWNGMNWINLGQDRNKWLALANVTMNLYFRKILGYS
jgi:hypothetical protein